MIFENTYPQNTLKGYNNFYFRPTILFEILVHRHPFVIIETHILFLDLVWSSADCGSVIREPVSDINKTGCCTDRYKRNHTISQMR